MRSSPPATAPASRRRRAAGAADSSPAGSSISWTEQPVVVDLVRGVADEELEVEAGGVRPVQDRLDFELLAEPQRRQVVDLQLPDRGRHAVAEEILVADPVAAAEGHPGVLEVARVAPVPDDAHRVDLLEADPPLHEHPRAARGSPSRRSKYGFLMRSPPARARSGKTKPPPVGRRRCGLPEIGGRPGKAAAGDLDDRTRDDRAGRTSPARSPSTAGAAPSPPRPAGSPIMIWHTAGRIGRPGKWPAKPGKSARTRSAGGPCRPAVARRRRRRWRESPRSGHFVDTPHALLV